MAEEKEDQSSYSPLLASMLRIDPDKVATGNFTLSALGRQAMGADSPEYATQKKEVDEARQALIDAYKNREDNLDAVSLGMARGAFMPTRTGSFGESLGNILAGAQSGNEAVDARRREQAKLRLEMGIQGLSEQERMAQMGLNVASKLTPSENAFQKQVRAEGLDPRSVAGIERVKELQAISTATPDQKEFSARTGIKITDPTFHASFGPYNAKLQDKVTQMGLDIKNPTHIKLAQQALQSDDALEQQSKRQRIEAEKAQIDKIRMEINDAQRDGGTGVTKEMQEYAKSLGVPVHTNLRYANMTAKERVEARNKDTQDGRAYIEKNISPAINTVDDDINDLRRAAELNKKLGTNPLYGASYGIGPSAQYLSGDKALIDEFQALSLKAAKQAKIPGDHNISNFDVQTMQKQVFSPTKYATTNKSIIDYMLAQRLRDKDYYNYMNSYAAVNGHVGPEADAAWRKYLDANPITRLTKDGKIEINPSRMPYQQYFTAPRVKLNAKGEPETTQ